MAYDTTSPRFSYDHVHACLCIMEELIDPVASDMPRPWETYRDNNGVNALRDVVIHQLAKPCLAAWNRAYRDFETVVHNAPTREAASRTPDPGSFDYDFVPIWLRHCVDWSVPNNPRVRGSERLKETSDA